MRFCSWTDFSNQSGRTQDIIHLPVCEKSIKSNVCGQKQTTMLCCGQTLSPADAGPLNCLRETCYLTRLGTKRFGAVWIESALAGTRIWPVEIVRICCEDSCLDCELNVRNLDKHEPQAVYEYLWWSLVSVILLSNWARNETTVEALGFLQLAREPQHLASACHACVAQNGSKIKVALDGARVDLSEMRKHKYPSTVHSNRNAVAVTFTLHLNAWTPSVVGGMTLSSNCCFWGCAWDRFLISHRVLTHTWSYLKVLVTHKRNKWNSIAASDRGSSPCTCVTVEVLKDDCKGAE